ncbi:hypothetical protein [Sphingomonas sp. 28-63-12]|uniref:hypothetical protein n=1 Tax=Sphingomonas sp. 28-63-12 TaxID=1970434 RepID=UPI0035A8A542
MRFAVELMHVALGIVAALVIAAAAAWAVPLAHREIWLVDYVAIIFIIAMGYRPLREAWAADRAADRAGRTGEQS